MKKHSSFRRLLRSPILRCAVVALVVLACSAPAFCDKIHDAAQNGDLKKVRVLIEHHPDLVFSKDKDGATPLHLAAIYGHKDVAELLLANKADVNARSNHERTPLHWAAVTGKLDVIELLLANKAELNARTDWGATPLHVAAWWGKQDVVTLLLASGAEVNAKENDGKTPLHLAAEWNGGDNSRLPQLLLANHADVNAKDNNGQTPLWAAEARGRTAVAEVLRQYAGRERATTATTIHGFAREGDVAKVQALLKDNPDLVFSKDVHGDTPLHGAAFNGHKDVAELLLASKADVNAKNNLGVTPLHSAAANGHNDVVELLLASHADVNAEDNDGDTPLFSALAFGHDEMAGFLAQNAANSKPMNPAVAVLGKFLRKAYFVPNDPSQAPQFDPATAATYRENKITYYKSFASIDDNGYTFALNLPVPGPQTLVKVPVGQDGYKLVAVPIFLRGRSVRVKFTDVTRIKTWRGGYEVQLLADQRELDDFLIPSGSGQIVAIQKDLRALCPNAEW